MKTLGKFLAGMLLALGVATASNAAVVTIDFGGLPGGNGDPFSSYSEDGFTVTSTGGSWFEAHAYGNPLPSIFGGPIFSPVAGTIRIVANGGGPFSLSSFDLSTNNGASDYVISGLLNGGVAFNALGNDSTITQFETIGGNLTLVDELFITVSPLGGTTSFNIDNIVLTTVDRQLPEPGSLALLGAALAVAGWRSRRNQRA